MTIWLNLQGVGVAWCLFEIAEEWHELVNVSVVPSTYVMILKQFQLNC